MLDLNGFFGRENVLGAVQVGAEYNTVVGDFAKVREAENLKAARIGENRSRPGHEFMQSAQRANALVAGAQVQVIGVAQQILLAQLAERLLRKTLHRARRAHRNKRRCIDHAVRRRQPPEPRARWIRFQNFKLEIHPHEFSRTA